MLAHTVAPNFGTSHCAASALVFWILRHQNRWYIGDGQYAIRSA